jgi:hypothetical protein
MELGPHSAVHLTIANVGAVATEILKEAMIYPKEEVAMLPEKCARLLLGTLLVLHILINLGYMLAKNRVMMPLVRF